MLRFCGFLPDARLQSDVLDSVQPSAKGVHYGIKGTRAGRCPGRQHGAYVSSSSVLLPRTLALLQKNLARSVHSNQPSDARSYLSERLGPITSDSVRD
jgi:hypothetical protein